MIAATSSAAAAAAVTKSNSLKSDRLLITDRVVKRKRGKTEREGNFNYEIVTGRLLSGDSEAFVLNIRKYNQH